MFQNTSIVKSKNYSKEFANINMTTAYVFPCKNKIPI